MKTNWTLRAKHSWGWSTSTCPAERYWSTLSRLVSKTLWCHLLLTVIVSKPAHRLLLWDVAMFSLQWFEQLQLHGHEWKQTVYDKSCTSLTERIFMNIFTVLLDWPITVRTVSVITTNNHVLQIIDDIIIRLSHSSNRSFFNFTWNSLNRTDFLLPLLPSSPPPSCLGVTASWNTGRGGGGGGSSLYPPSSPTESLRHASQPTS